MPVGINIAVPQGRWVAVLVNAFHVADFGCAGEAQRVFIIAVRAPASCRRKTVPIGIRAAIQTCFAGFFASGAGRTRTITGHARSGFALLVAVAEHSVVAVGRRRTLSNIGQTTIHRIRIRPAGESESESSDRGKSMDELVRHPEMTRRSLLSDKTNFSGASRRDIR